MGILIRLDYAANRLRVSGTRPKSAWTLELIRQMEMRMGRRDREAAAGRHNDNLHVERSLPERTTSTEQAQRRLDLIHRKQALAAYMATNKIEGEV